LTLNNLVGTDPAGYAGLEDDVDWHWKRIFAGAALTTLLGIGAELAAPENRQDGNRIILAGRDSAQDTVNQIGQEVTRRNLNIQPTLTSRPGLPVRIIVNKDYNCDPTSRYSSIEEYRNDNTQTMPRPVAKDGIHQADLRLPGQPQSQSRPLRYLARANLRRNRQWYYTDSAHARSLHGRGQRIQKRCAYRALKRKTRQIHNLGGFCSVERCFMGCGSSARRVDNHWIMPILARYPRSRFQACLHRCIHDWDALERELENAPARCRFFSRCSRSALCAGLAHHRLPSETLPFA